MANKVLIQVPISEKDLLKVSQENFRKLGRVTDNVNKVTTDVYSTSRDPGKVKATSADTAADYLNRKLIAGNDIDLIETTDGSGEKTLVANLNVYASNSAPANPTNGQLWLDLDEPFGTPFTIGDGAAGVDYELKFDGETYDGSLYWMEDEDYFKFVDSILMDAAKEIYFRDTAIHIKSADDGHLDLTADTSIDINGLMVTTAGRIGKVTTVTDTYIILTSDDSVICNKATAFTVTLPTATVGQKYEISNINTGTVTVEGDGTDTIDGAANITIGQWDNVILQCYAANKWKVK